MVESLHFLKAGGGDMVESPQFLTERGWLNVCLF